MARCLQLNSGAKMPILGLGTWQSKPEEVIRAVETAIDCGYRHIDTAFAYKNEKEIGIAIKNKINEGKIKREDLFVVTKLPPSYNEKSLVRHSITQSLAALGLSYVDLFLVHSPIRVKNIEGTIFPIENGKLQMEPVDHLSVWTAMEEIYHEGLTKSIGLSNFNKRQIQRIWDNAKVKPSNLQVECHLYFPQFQLHDYCNSLGITFTAYAPFGSPDRTYLKPVPGSQPPLNDQTVAQLGEKYKKTPAQILLRWTIQRGINVIPKSVTPERIRSNFEVFDFELSKEEMNTLNNIGVNKRTFNMGGMIPEDYPEYPYHDAY